MIQGTALSVLLTSLTHIGAPVSPAAQGSAQHERVLVIHSYHEGLTWTDGENEGIREVLGSREDLEIFVEYLDSKRYPLEEVAPPFAAFLKAKYAGKAFDAIIATDNNALAFLSDRRAELFTGTPVVFCGVNDFSPELLKEFGGRATGVCQALDVKGTLELIQALQPGVRVLAIVSGTTPTARSIRKQVASALASERPQFETLPLDELHTRELLARLANLTRDDAVLLCNFNRDAGGVYYTHEESARMISEASPAPVYAMEDLYIGTGVTGGCMVSAVKEGRAAARMCLRVLETGELPGVDSKSSQSTLVDHHALVRFGLDASRLPAGAVILNRPESFYERHKKLVWSLVTVFCLLVLALGGVTFGLLRSRQAARKLAHNEESLRCTLGSIGDAVIATDTEGVIRRMNPVAERLTGWTLEQAMGHPLEQVFDIVDARTRTRSQPPVQRVMESGQVVGLANHTLLIARDGTEHQIADSAAPICDDAGTITGVVLIFRDVTGEYDMRRSLAESEERYRLAQHLSGIGTWEWNLVTGEIIWSEEVEAIWGFDPGGFGGTYEEVAERIHPDDRKRWEENTTACLERGQEHEIEYRIVWANGTVRWIAAFGNAERDARGKVLRMMGVVLDITERKNAEDGLLREKLLTEEYINSLPGLFYVFDEEGFVQWNQAFERVTGYGPEELRSMYGADFFVGEDRKLIRERMLQVFRDGAASVEAELVTKDGRRIPYYFTGLRRDFGGRPHLIGLGLDITERKRAEKERLELEAQLQKSQRMEAIGQLAGGIAHDFNNILTAILGNVEMSMAELRSNLDEEHTAMLSLGEIAQASQRAAALIRQLLTFSRKDVTQPTTLDLNQVIEDLDKMLRRIITEAITFETITDPQLHPIRADAGQIEQVVVNLVVNAVHAMPEGGRLTLETRNVVLDESYTCNHAEASPGPHVMLAVNDTGHGMDARTLERIFEPFFSTKPTDMGTGLGLATVHGTIKRSGGHIMVYSEPGRGSSFKIFLPALEGVAAEATERRSTDSPAGGHETILLCEDDEAVRDLVARSLQSLGYTVITASSGLEGIRVAGEHSGPIDLLITDVIMPDLNGRDLSERLRETFPELPTLFISGYTSNVIAHHGVLDEGVEFLEKPFTWRDLVAKIRAILEASASPRDES